jgi:hypothetical protein
MNKILHLFIGPELLWLVYYFLIILIIRWTHPPAKSLDPFWISFTYIIPLVLLPLSFILYYVPGVIRPWLLLRLWIAGIVGGHYVLSAALRAHSEQGPGVGTAYILGMGILFLVLIGGSIGAVIKF